MSNFILYSSRDESVDLNGEVQPGETNQEFVHREGKQELFNRKNWLLIENLQFFSKDGET